MKDWIINNWLLLKNRIAKHILRETYGKYFTLTRGKKLQYVDLFKAFTESDLDSKYIRQQYWGKYHPDNLQQWYDPSAIELKDDGLHLKITENKFTVTDNPDHLGYEIKNGVGLVTSKTPFSYGYYRWVFKLPKGINLWPAIWLSHSETWPPEIDVFEGYSGDKGEFGKNINTNIYCGNKPANHYGLGAFRGGFLVSKEDSVIMHLHWTKDFIKIYYNGFLVRVVTDKKNLQWFNVKPSMWLILNAALQKSPKNISEVTERDFIVESFKYYTD